jgi:hypothetical protein
VDVLGIKTVVREDWGCYYFDKNHIFRQTKVCFSKLCTTLLAI